jgi:hypothetical protein
MELQFHFRPPLDRPIEHQLPEQRYPNTKSEAATCESERNFVTFLRKSLKAAKLAEPR